MRFAEHNEVVERFATDRSDQPLDMAILPRRARCGMMIADLHCWNCIWGCWMPVEVIIDQWNPSRRRYRTETFC